MSEYHYIQSEPGLWTVGTGRPGKGGDWEPESDHESPEDAAERVRYLNGGNDAVSEMAALLRRANGLLHRCKRIIESQNNDPHLIEGDLESLYWDIDECLDKHRGELTS